MQIKPLHNRIAQAVLCTGMTLISGCYVTVAEFNAYKSEQAISHGERQTEINNLNILVQCRNEVVRNFIKNCASNGPACSIDATTEIIENMLDFKHIMLRLAFVPDEAPKLAQDQMADLIQLFETRRKSTQVLLVAMPGHKPQVTQIKPKARNQKKIQAPPQNNYEPYMMTDQLYSVLAKLKESFTNPPYNLNVRTAASLGSQIPSCNNKSDKLINTFRKKPGNGLRTHEADLKKDYFDLIVFLVDCQ